MKTETTQYDQCLLEERTNSLRLTKALTIIHNQSFNINQILQITLDEICTHMSWPVGHAYLYDKKSGFLTTSGLWYLEDEKKFEMFKEATKMTDFKINVGVLGKILESKKPLWIKDVQKDDDFLRGKMGFKISVRGGFTLPILIDNEVFGVLEFYSSKTLDPDLEMTDTMINIATKLSIAIQRKLSDDKLELDRKLMEENFVSLKEHDSHLEACWKGSREGSWSVNLITGKVIFSDRWKMMIGYEPQEISDDFDEWSSRVHTEDYEETQVVMNKHLNGKGPYLQEYRIKTKSGQWRWFKCSGQASWDENGVPYRLAGASTDVHDEKMMVEALMAAKRKAEDFNRSKTNFLSNMSHEIRTPMNGVIGMASLLKITKLDDTQKEYVQLILESSDHLMQIINNILDISKIEAGKIELENIDFDLKYTAQEVISLMSTSAKDKNINFNLQYPKEIPTHAFGDQGRVRQILFNLISNAIKFTEDGSIDIIFNLERLEGGRLFFKISVKDQGIGLAPDKLEKIFNKFDQADISTTRKFGGTGLGLPICRELAQLMGGDMSVESRLGEGSDFYFTINLGVADDKCVDVVEAKDQILAEPMNLENTSILLAEDNSVNQKVMTSLLKRYGCLVTPAGNGEEAVDQVRKQKFDIILMDCQMPEMDGYEATKIIRELERKKQQSANVIIAVTAHSLKGDKEKCLEAGMDDYLSKPVNIKNLEDILERWVVGKKRSILA
ncbi:MAG: PAS domain S-box-containing protein [Rickettsiales bacterium]|jgi:PAS domain S-box-containing protein